MSNEPSPSSGGPSVSHVILTVIGADRPGIVGDLSQWVFENGGNIEESHMALLGGDFAVLMLAAGPPDFAEQLGRNGADFERRTGLHLFIHSSQAAPRTPESPVIRYALSATTLDHPGIVYRLSALLKMRGINVIHAETRNAPAPFTGTPIFHLNMQIDVPATLPIAGLRRELEALCAEQNIDFELKVR